MTPIYRFVSFLGNATPPRHPNHAGDAGKEREVKLAHYKRRRRRKGGIKGHCYLCSLRRFDGHRNSRRLTPREQSSLVSFAESVNELGLALHVVSRATLRRSRRS